MRGREVSMDGSEVRRDGEEEAEVTRGKVLSLVGGCMDMDPLELNSDREDLKLLCWLCMGNKPLLSRLDRDGFSSLAGMNISMAAASKYNQ